MRGEERAALRVLNEMAEYGMRDRHAVEGGSAAPKLIKKKKKRPAAAAADDEPQPADKKPKAQAAPAPAPPAGALGGLIAYSGSSDSDP